MDRTSIRSQASTRRVLDGWQSTVNGSVQVSTRAPCGESGPHLIIGDTNVARRVCAWLVQREEEVLHLIEPDEGHLRKAMHQQPAGVAVLVHEDVAALRYALAAAHIAPAVPMVVTIFDHTISEQLARLLPTCHVTSPGALSVPSLVAACLDPDTVAIRRTGQTTTAVRRVDDTLTEMPWALNGRERRRVRLDRIAGQLRPHDAGTRLMLAGLGGLFTVLTTDWAFLVFRAEHQPVEALHEAARVVAAVGPADTGDQSVSYLLASALAMLLTVVLTAAFTAGLVDRLLGPQLVGLLGPRTLPRSDHVIVVGLGQVGLRLCQELRRLGIGVVAVERDEHAPHLRIARTLHIPVVVAHGADRTILERLRLPHARALAAVGSDDLDNITVAVTANAVAPDTRVVLRAGEHEAIAETRSLLPLGTTHDITSLSATYVLARLLGLTATAAIATDDRTYVETADNGFVCWTNHTVRDTCTHRNNPHADSTPSSTG